MVGPAGVARIRKLHYYAPIPLHHRIGDELLSDQVADAKEFDNVAITVRRGGKTREEQACAGIRNTNRTVRRLETRD